jgi:hypothetical protein
VPDFAELFDDMQEFISHSKASEFVKLCMRDIAAADPRRGSSRAQQSTPGLAAKWCETSLTHSFCGPLQQDGTLAACMKAISA